MKNIYIAKRIPINPDAKYILDVGKNMKPEDVFRIYIDKTEPYGFFIYNGPWILRPPLSTSVFSENTMPENLTTGDIWQMVKTKIESSQIFLGIIGSKSYGTIAETGYACKCKNLAVYVLPESGIQKDDLNDLWFIFQMSIATEDLWCDEDIKKLKEFSVLGITSICEYKLFISNIIPNFMKK